MLYRTSFSLTPSFHPPCSVWKELRLLLAKQLFLPCSHYLSKRNKLCKSSCWQFKWLLVCSQWVWLHHTVDGCDSEWNGAVQTPFYYSPVLWVRQEKSQHLRQSAAKANRNDGYGPTCKGGQCAKQQSAGPGQAFFLLFEGLKRIFVAGQNSSALFFHAFNHLWSMRAGAWLHVQSGDV